VGGLYLWGALIEEIRYLFSIAPGQEFRLSALAAEHHSTGRLSSFLHSIDTSDGQSRFLDNQCGNGVRLPKNGELSVARAEAGQVFIHFFSCFFGCCCCFL